MMNANPEMSFNQASNIAPVANHQSATSMYSVRGAPGNNMQSSFHDNKDDARQSFDKVDSTGTDKKSEQYGSTATADNV